MVSTHEGNTSMMHHISFADKHSVHSKPLHGNTNCYLISQGIDGYMEPINEENNEDE